MEKPELNLFNFLSVTVDHPEVFPAQEEKSATKAHDGGPSHEEGKHLKGSQPEEGKTEESILLQLS